MKEDMKERRNKIYVGNTNITDREEKEEIGRVKEGVRDRR